MTEVAFWPVLTSGVVTALIGWVWYHPRVFGSAWMRMSGITPEMAERGKKRMPLYAFIAFLGSLVIASVMNYLGTMWPVDDWASAIWLGFLCWAGFVMSPMLGVVLWEQKPVRLYLINVVYWLVIFLVVPSILFVGSQASNAGVVDTEAGGESAASQQELRKIQLDNQVVRVSVADTPESRGRGLGGRAGLAFDEGMLFVFPQDGRYGFWMKDMLFAIDILWISADQKVVHIAPNVSPSTYPQRFESSEPARYVLELPAGYTRVHGVKIGDIVRF